MKSYDQHHFHLEDLFTKNEEKESNPSKDTTRIIYYSGRPSQWRELGANQRETSGEKSPLKRKQSLYLLVHILWALPSLPWSPSPSPSPSHPQRNLF